MIKLGETNQYPDAYSAELLEPIPRAAAREKLGLDAAKLPFQGKDIWTAFEVSWLRKNGLPVSKIAEFSVPCGSRAIYESKSFKYYLNSFNQERYVLDSDPIDRMREDLASLTGSPVEIQLFDVDAYSKRSADYAPHYQLLEALDLSEYNFATSQPEAHQVEWIEQTGLRRYASHLLKTNCPLTGQPDWASVFITIDGQQPEPISLLKYLIAFRDHQDYHEHCVERIFIDLARDLAPQQLCVSARYTRRGGIDINPIRYTPDYPFGKSGIPEDFATYRQ